MQQLTETEILEGNKLIAAFMDKVYREHGMPDIINFLELPCESVESHSFEVEDLLYHSCWDWLMPVVEKIIEIDITPAPNWSGYRVEIVPRGYVQISGFPMTKITKNVSVEGSLINATYKAVVEFFKYYNNQNK